MSYRIHGGIVREVDTDGDPFFYFVRSSRSYFHGAPPNGVLKYLQVHGPRLASFTLYEGCTYTLEIPKEFLE